MTGSGLNASRYSILPGHALSEDESGNVVPADTTHVAFAVAVTGAPPNGRVSYTMEGIVTRSDWTLITGLPRLSVGTTYYATSNGRLAKTGNQPIGVARNATDLRVNIGAVQPSFSQVHTVRGMPASSLGEVGDMAYDSTLGRWFGPKDAGGWPPPRYMITPILSPAHTPILAHSNQDGRWNIVS